MAWFDGDGFYFWSFYSRKIIGWVDDKIKLPPNEPSGQRFEGTTFRIPSVVVVPSVNFVLPVNIAQSVNIVPHPAQCHVPFQILKLGHSVEDCCRIV